jgi:hypothetical protein
MAWLSIVPAADVPFDQQHVALYSYFPAFSRPAPGEPSHRPYVWRALDAKRLAVLSSVRSTAPRCAQITAEAGVTYAFETTIKRVRVCKGRYITFHDYGELCKWIKYFASNRGAQIGFISVKGFGELKFQKKVDRVRIPIAHVRGKMLVTDAAMFDAVLCGGGPGTGKAYGCGMWWLPEVMGHMAVEVAA